MQNSRIGTDASIERGVDVGTDGLLGMPIPTLRTNRLIERTFMSTALIGRTTEPNIRNNTTSVAPTTNAIA